jgi:glutamate synthase domain-containing protein 3
MISRHAEYTGSKVAAAILENWSDEFPRFRKIIPIKYREVLRQRAEAAAKA